MRDVLAQLAFDNQQRALELATGCARFFDIEDSLSEELVEAELKATRPVPKSALRLRPVENIEVFAISRNTPRSH